MRDQRGFSMMELAVVGAVVTVLAVVAAPSVYKQVMALKSPPFAEQLAQDLQSARARAAETGRPVAVSVSESEVTVFEDTGGGLPNGVYDPGEPIIRKRQVPQGVRLTLAGKRSVSGVTFGPFNTVTSGQGLLKGGGQGGGNGVMTGHPESQAGSAGTSQANGGGAQPQGSASQAGIGSGAGRNNPTTHSRGGVHGSSPANGTARVGVAMRRTSPAGSSGPGSYQGGASPGSASRGFIASRGGGLGGSGITFAFDSMGRCVIGGGDLTVSESRSEARTIRVSAVGKISVTGD